MTKLRQPVTFSDALTDIARMIGWDVCAQILGVSENWVRKLSDPDAEREISLQSARRLDAAYVRAGGEGAPFHDCYALQLELTAGLHSRCSADMIQAVGKAVKENGEAVSAALHAVEHGTPGARREAVREVQESIQAMTALLARLGAPEFFDGGRSDEDGRSG